jgi:PAS domain-containing protein
MNKHRANVKPADSTSGVQGEADFIPIFSELIRSREEWLINRILFYAKRQGYTRYTSTLKEAWRLSISGISAWILEALERLPDLELRPDEDYLQDPAAAFGLIEAERHRQRGVSLPMFLGLMKYYRQSYQDLIEVSELSGAGKILARRWVDCFFDRVEIAFCSAWDTTIDEDRLVELQSANRIITNEKNKYLTFFESIATAAILIDDNLRIVNLNRAAAQLFGLQTTPGRHYYQGFHSELSAPPEDGHLAALEPLRQQLSEELGAFARSAETMQDFEKSIDTAVGRRCFKVRLSCMLDVSDKFGGTVVLLEDFTERKILEEERLQREKLETVLEIAGAVCHELHQPLMALGGYHELIRFNVGEQSLAYKYLAKAYNQARRMSDITSRLMCITRYATRDYIGGAKILDIDKSAEKSETNCASDD